MSIGFIIFFQLLVTKISVYTDMWKLIKSFVYQKKNVFLLSWSFFSKNSKTRKWFFRVFTLNTCLIGMFNSIRFFKESSIWSFLPTVNTCLIGIKEFLLIQKFLSLGKFFPIYLLICILHMQMHICICFVIINIHACIFFSIK